MEQYCDGIAQCPDGGDEARSNCTCEDWGLRSCETDKKHAHMNCLNMNWVLTGILNDSDFKCLDLIHSLTNAEKMANERQSK